MTTTATKTYLVTVIERALAYYDVEAEDARSAAENWQDGEFSDRDDEALESEGPCSVRERQPDGTWRKVSPSEWEDETAAEIATSGERGGTHTPGPWDCDMDFIVAPDPNGQFPDIYIAEIATCDDEGRVAPHGQQRANRQLITTAPTMLVALKACELQLREYVRWHHAHAGGCSVEIESAWEQARAVIAEATTVND